MEDARDARKRVPKKRTVAGWNSSRFYSYHPTKNDKGAIDELFPEVEASLLVISMKLSQGFGFSLTYAEQTNSYGAVIREKGSNFEEQKAVSVWHGTPARAMAGLAYYLTVVNPSWPEGHPNWSQQEFEW